GRLDYRQLGGDGVMLIDFVNTESATDLSVATTLVVNGTDADDAIGYGAGAAAGNGRVTAGSLGHLDFSHKPNLTIHGLGGDDALTVVTPVGLDVVTLTPGAVHDQGTIAIRRGVGLGGDLLGLSFTNLGGLGFLTFDEIGREGRGADELVVVGSAGT